MVERICDCDGDVILMLRLNTPNRSRTPDTKFPDGLYSESITTHSGSSRHLGLPTPRNRLKHMAPDDVVPLSSTVWQLSLCKVQRRKAYLTRLVTGVTFTIRIRGF